MEERIIELGLFKRRKHDGESIFVRLGKLASRIFELVADIAVESEGLKTTEFRSRLARCRIRLDRISDSSSLESALQDGLTLCQNYFRQAQGYLLERETEIREVVEVLRQAVSTLTGDADSFSKRMLDSSARLAHLAEMEDVRQIKMLVAKEVSELTRIVVEKRNQEEVLYANMSKRCDLLRDKLKQTKQEGLLDPLTHVGNRRSIDQEIMRVTQLPGEKSLILAILDIDDFKMINDVHGHQVGDQALVHVAEWVGAQIRSGDCFGRYGGDEFVVLLVNTTLAQAEMRFLQLLANIAQSQFEYAEGEEVRSVRLTLSCGMSELLLGDKPDDLMRRADKALYQAKSRGKNCLVTRR